MKNEVLKSNVWGANLTGVNGNNGINDIEFGSTENQEPAIRLGDTVVTPDTIGGNKIFTNLTKISDYLYEITYDNLDENFAKKYFEKYNKPQKFSCSSVRNGDFYGRNFDWYYNNEAYFIVHTKASDGRFSSVGVAGMTGFDKNAVDSGDVSDEYKILPFFMQDGINEYGVTCNINVVPTRETKTYGTEPLIYKRDEICSASIVRYVLDHYMSASQAVNDIRDYVSVYANKKLWETDYETHLMVADKNNTYLLEFIDNKIVITDMTDGANSNLAGKPYMTNFILSDITLNVDGTVYTPETQDETHNAVITNKIDPLGSGLERYNLIVNNYSNCDTKNGMTNLMFNLLKYTNAYQPTTDPFWYTEFVGVNGLTCASEVEDFGNIKDIAKEAYDNRTREDGSTWQSAHTSIYDIDKKELYVYCQEEGPEFVFNIEETDRSLPVVSEEDNGKILKVVDGKWQLVSLS